jgi:tape measure domain-containing protein
MPTQTDVLRTIIDCKGAETAAKQFGMLGKAAGETDAKLRAAADRAGQISMLAAGLGTGMLAAAGGLIKVAGAAEQAQIAFTTLLKSPQEAKRHLSELAAFAAHTPFEFAGLRTLSTQLLAFSFTARDVVPMLTTLGDAGSALGKGPEGLERMIRAIGQMHAKGRVQMQELLQLTEAGVPAFEILQDELGLTAAQVGEIGRQGVSAKDGIAALLRGMDKLYGGGMAQQSESLFGVLSNLSDQFQLLGMEIGETLLPYAKSAAESVVKLTEALRDASPATKAAVGAMLLFGGVGMILVSVAARVKNLQLLWQLSAAMKKRAAAEAVVAEKTEQSAVMQTAAAYRQKAVALAASGDTRAANAAFGAMVGNAGTWANAPLAANTSMLSKASTALGGAFTSLKVAVLGLLSPLNVLAIGLIGIGYMYKRMVSDEWAKAKENQKQYEDMAENAPHQQIEWFGTRRSGERVQFGPTKPDIEEWARKTRGYEFSENPGLAWDAKRIMRPTYEADLWQAPVGIKPGNENERAIAKHFQQATNEWLDSFRQAAELASTQTQRAQAMEGAGLGASHTGALLAESRAHAQLMQALQRAASTETNAEAKKKLLTESEKARTDGIMAATTAIRENQRAEEEAARQSQEQAKAAINAKREAVEAYTKAIQDQTNALNETLSIGNAYAQYLDTIGRKAEADQYRKGALAQQAASVAQWHFRIGDPLGGWQAATQAEQLARTGMGGSDSLGFGGGGAQGALTGAVPGYIAQAAQRQTQPIQVHIDNTVRDEAGTIRARMRREDRHRYYAIGAH